MLFRRWSEIEAVSNLSPLYGVLGHTVADDPELLDLANECLPGQPPPNILFAAVHAFLAAHPDEPLARYYPSQGGRLPAAPEAAPLFRDLCLRNRDALLPIIRTGLTQTNEVRRSALLLPALQEIARDSGSELALIEIGPSAGLNLNFDLYHYRYGAVELGDPDSQLTLETEVRGAVPRGAIPEVAGRAGIDLNPLDVRNPADVAWLRALIWPEHADRLALLNAAIAIAMQHPPALHKGEFSEWLPQLVANTNESAAICIVATFVLNQLAPEDRAQLRRELLRLSAGRTMYMVVIGFPTFVEPNSQLPGEEQVWLLRLRGGQGEYRLTAIANPHGRWIELRPGSPWKPWTESA